MSGPPNYTYRRALPADAHAIGRVQLTSWRATFQKIAPPGYLEQFNFDERAEGWVEILTETDQIVWVAEDESSQIVGYICGGPAHLPDDTTQAAAWLGCHDVEVYSLHLLPTHHQQGIGKHLMQVFSATAFEQGFQSLMLWVLTDNSNAIAFYEHLGGQHFDQHSIPMNEKWVTEEAYRWPTIQSFIA